MREHASRAALESSPRFAGVGLAEVARAAVAEEVRAFLERRVAGTAAAVGVKKEEEGEEEAAADAAPPAAAREELPSAFPAARRAGGRAKREAQEEKEAGAKGGRVAHRAPRKASTASFIVSDDADEEDEDGDYEEDDSDDDDDDDSEEESEEEGEGSDADESKAAAAAPPPKKRAKRGGGGGGRPAATAATSVGESPAVFRENEEGRAGAGARPPGSAAAAANVAKPSASVPAVLRFPLGERRFASVSRLGGTRRLDVREWYLPKGAGAGAGGEEGEGGLRPGLKGISLGAAAVKALRGKASALDEALKGGRDFSFALEEKKSGNDAGSEGGGGSQGGGSAGGGWQQKAPTRKVAATSLWQNVWRVDLREHFLANGENWRPTKKGISLSPSAWAKLVESLPELESAVVGGGGSL